MASQSNIGIDREETLANYLVWATDWGKSLASKLTIVERSLESMSANYTEDFNPAITSEEAQAETNALRAAIWGLRIAIRDAEQTQQKGPSLKVTLARQLAQAGAMARYNAVLPCSGAVRPFGGDDHPQGIRIRVFDSPKFLAKLKPEVLFVRLTDVLSQSGISEVPSLDADSSNWKNSSASGDVKFDLVFDDEESYKVAMDAKVSVRRKSENGIEEWLELMPVVQALMTFFPKMTVYYVKNVECRAEFPTGSAVVQEPKGDLSLKQSKARK